MAMAEEYEEVFKKGTIVEVSSEDEGLRGSWYTATVIRTISRTTNKILIEYHNLMADDAGTKPLREFVDAVLMRPIPPRDPPSRRFRLMEDVDAYHHDGWWEGVVTAVIETPQQPLYAVFFRCSREQIQFSASDLRVHREWVRANQWVPIVDPTLSPRQKKKNGDHDKGERRNSHSGDKGITSNGEVTNIGRKSHNVSSTQDGVAKKANNNGTRTISSRSGKRDAVNGKRTVIKEQRKGSNSAGNKLGVRRNGKLKEPRKRATSHADRGQSKK